MKRYWPRTLAVVACLLGAPMADAAQLHMLDELDARMEPAGWNLLQKDSTSNGDVYRWRKGADIAWVEIATIASPQDAKQLLDKRAMTVTVDTQRRIDDLGDEALLFQGKTGCMILLRKGNVFLHVYGSSANVARQFAQTAVGVVGR